MLFLVFARTPSLGSEPSFYDYAFGLLASHPRAPMCSGGPIEGWLIFVIVTPSVVSTTEGVELTSLASVARVTCSVSSLTGTFK